MSKFSRSVAEDLRANPALSTLIGSLNLDTDEGVAATASIGSAVLGRLVGASDASHSATPLADALLLVPYETVSEALGDFENLQFSGNDLLDGLFREKRGSAAIEIAREANVATSAVGRLFPFVAPVIVAGLRSHGRRMGLSAEGLLSWLRTEEHSDLDLETHVVETRHSDAESPIDSNDTDQPESPSSSLASFLSLEPENPAPQFSEVEGQILDEASDVAPSLLVADSPSPDDSSGFDFAKSTSEFDFFGRSTEPKPSTIEDPDSPVQPPSPFFDQTFDYPDLLSSGDPLADLRSESNGELIVRTQDPDDLVPPEVGDLEMGDPASDSVALVAEYRDIDYLRDHGEREDVSKQKSSPSSLGVSGLAWLWWIVGSMAVILVIALLPALAGSS